jgi:orotate phosphoribosyltransferase
MTTEETVAILKGTGALLEGHFLLTSGLHSDRYIQCALALRMPDKSGMLGAALGARFTAARATMVAGPALGGVIIAHEVARALKVPCIFSERVEGIMTIRRGFAITPADRVVLVEDVVTTGGSVMELARLVTEAGAEIAGYGCVVDRGAAELKIPRRPESLARLELPAWEPSQCPLCQKGIPAVKPGSRPGAGRK